MSSGTLKLMVASGNMKRTGERIVGNTRKLPGGTFAAIHLEWPKAAFCLANIKGCFSISLYYSKCAMKIHGNIDRFNQGVLNEGPEGFLNPYRFRDPA